MILDQRHMSGPEQLQSVEQVEEFWRRRGEQVGFLQRPPAERGPELRSSRTRLAARVDDGRWLADCPRCRSGIACWPENPRGACLGCGTVYPIDFPSADERAAADEALAARPKQHRFWTPGAESVEDLKVENVTRGFLPSSAAEARISELASAAGLAPGELQRAARVLGVDPGAAA